jgi:hypothetical protein
MTITQHLEFSVLTAPLAAVDRRGLSQAWYSALYGESATPAQATQVKKAPAFAYARQVATKTSQGETAAARRPVTLKATPHRKADVSVSNGTADRRAQRSPLARKIERVFLDPKARMQKASFALEAGEGRVQVLLRTQGSNVKLVALCPRKAIKQVAAALAQARYALARRGIALETELRDAVSC